MPFVNQLYDKNFLEYASYVIKDRAIPHLNDGLKPVQRRILHSLIEMDDGRFHKVANVVGHTMKYHPHGDASIYSALVVLANKDLFIDKQGNFGNQFTGHAASAARYIECRLLPIAKKLLYSPEITEYEDSYDGRNKEPVTFPCKIPLVLVQGAEGIAVGMTTKILPHNLEEVLTAVQCALRGEPFRLFPDFFTGGYLDVSDYRDGNGKVLCRAKFDITKDGKKIIIRELPFGVTTESLTESIEAAARRGKIKVSHINDLTAEEVAIEIHLARGVQASEVIDSLYAYTDCEISIPVNLLVIEDRLPKQMTVTDVIRHHAGHLTSILKAELENDKRKLEDKHHARTLEQIFIEERIYKKIETVKTAQGVIDAVLKGLAPFADIIRREVTTEDVERLLRIPIRRISLYDINKAKEEMRQIENEIKEIKKHLKNIVAYAVGYLDEIKKEFPAETLKRKTEITSFTQVAEKQAAKRDQPLYYDAETGYLGLGVRSGKELFRVSEFDRILMIPKGGFFKVVKVSEKLFVDKGLQFACLADKEEIEKLIFTAVYKEKKSGNICLKRFKIEKFITDKTYPFIPEDSSLLKLTIKTDVAVNIVYEPAPRVKILEETFRVSDYLVKGWKAAGVRLTSKKVKSLKWEKAEPEKKKEKGK